MCALSTFPHNLESITVIRVRLCGVSSSIAIFYDGCVPGSSEVPSPTFPTKRRIPVRTFLSGHTHRPLTRRICNRSAHTNCLSHHTPQLAHLPPPEHDGTPAPAPPPLPLRGFVRFHPHVWFLAAAHSLPISRRSARASSVPRGASSSAHGSGSSSAAAKPKKKRTNPRRDTMEQERLENIRRKDKERKRLRRDQMSEDERNRTRERDKERKAAKRREQRSRSLALSMKLPPVSSILNDGYPVTMQVPQPLQPPPQHQRHHHGHHPTPSMLPLPHPHQYSSSSYKHPVDR